MGGLVLAIVFILVLVVALVFALVLVLVCVYTYVHTYIHTYIHTYMIYIYIYVYIYTCTYIRACHAYYTGKETYLMAHDIANICTNTDFRSTDCDWATHGYVISKGITLAIDRYTSAEAAF